MRVNVPAVRFRIEILREGIFADPALESRSSELAALEQRRLVIAGPTVTARARLAQVSGQHQRQVRGAVRFGCVKPMIDPLALVNRTWLDRANVPRQLLDQVLRRT